MPPDRLRQPPDRRLRSRTVFQVANRSCCACKGASNLRLPLPLDLKLYLFFITSLLVLNGEGGSGRNINSLTRDLDVELRSALNGVRQPPQLSHEVGFRVFLLDVPLLLGCHFNSFVDGGLQREPRWLLR